MNSSRRLKLLLDTTYLLPVVGIDVEGVEDAIVTLKNLRDRGIAEYYYTQFNLLEIIGKLSRLKYERERVLVGLVSIIEEFKELTPTAKALVKALDLRMNGFRDLIDLLLYTTSLSRGVLFLTRDKQLIEFLKKHGEPTNNIMYEEELIKKYMK